MPRPTARAERLAELAKRFGENPETLVAAVQALVAQGATSAEAIRRVVPALLLRRTEHRRAKRDQKRAENRATVVTEAAQRAAALQESRQSDRRGLISRWAEVVGRVLDPSTRLAPSDAIAFHKWRKEQRKESP